jgi:phosphoesterase RecJ-like protein
MALTATQQTLELVKQSKSILIAFKRDWTGDDLASGLALAEVLKKIGKKTEVLCQDFKPGANLSFLSTSLVQNNLKNIQKFIISIDTSRTQLGEFYYDKSESRLNIYITPQAGQLEDKDVSTAVSNYQYDLIFIVSSPDLESLGRVYEQHADFFYTTPKINIDHSSRNEHFGDINLVNIAASSTAEIVYSLIREFDEKMIDEHIATALLAGIIMATKNFKLPNITPRTLHLASLLVAGGARREQIIQNLYQNKYLSTLKLWGRVLTRLNNDLGDRLVWSSLSALDFLETATTPEEINEVVDELIVSMPKTEAIVLLYETKKERQQTEINVLVFTIKNRDALLLTKKFNPSGTGELAKFLMADVSLAEAERLVISEIKQKFSL